MELAAAATGVGVMAPMGLAAFRMSGLADGNPASLSCCAGPRRSNYPDGSASAE